MTAICAHRTAGVDLKKLPLPTTDFETGRAVKPHLIGLPNARPVDRPQQRLRLGDFRHLRRWREPFDCRRENRVGFGGTAGRLIEPGERQHRAQFEAARALLLRDGDGGQEGFFRRRGLAGSR
jgi:hypothetical protein